MPTFPNVHTVGLSDPATPLALEWIPPPSRPEKIDFTNEWPVFTQSNMDESNFIIDADGKMCLIDFEDIVLLPQSFASYTVRPNSSDTFLAEVARYLNWPHSPNHFSMARASAILQMMGDRTLGLDENGQLRPGQPKARS